MPEYSDYMQACLSEGKLFEDRAFPAADDSLYYSRKPPRPFEWKRPGEICDDPQFFVDGASRLDVVQGILGDGWLLSAISSLAQNENLLYKVVPQDQSFKDNYAGIFHFQFWQYGQWTDVFIDDRLPTQNNKLVFLHSSQPNEFWTALLEKAYAKLYGSYEALKGGQSSEAMEDFTGGLTEVFIPEKQSDLFSILKSAKEKKSLMCCSINAKQTEVGAAMAEGLIRGHAYTITGVNDVEIPNKGAVQLIRLRNPMGNEKEWTGAWSDYSEEWKSISEEERARLGITVSDDGEFWMAYSDFSSNFTRVEVCNLGPDSSSYQSTDNKTWQAHCFNGSWIKKISAGGSRNHPDTFSLNPQFEIEVTDVDLDSKASVIIALMQKNRRKMKKNGAHNLTIGYAVYNTMDAKAEHKKPALKFREPPVFAKLYSAFSSAVEKVGPPVLETLSKLGPVGEKITAPVSAVLDKVKSGVENVPIPEGMGKIDGVLPSKGITGAPDVRITETGVNQHFFLNTKTSARATKFTNSREVTERHDLQPGKYIIIPSTFNPDEEGEFILRLFTEGKKDIVKNLDGAAGLLETESKTAKLSTEDDEKLDKMSSFFLKAAGADGELDPDGLRKLINRFCQDELQGESFSLETCKSLVATMDLDRTGKLDKSEFLKAWTELLLWKKCFSNYDKDQSCSIDGTELKNALKDCGMVVSTPTISTLLLRFQNENSQLGFDEFIHCVIRVKTLLEHYEKYGITIGVNEYIQASVYN